MNTTTTHTIARITKGAWKNAIVKPCEDSMECPRFMGANGETITICYITDDSLVGETGLILALKDNELRWL